MYVVTGPTSRRAVSTGLRWWLLQWRRRPVQVSSSMSASAAQRVLADSVTSLRKLVLLSVTASDWPPAVSGRVTKSRVRLSAARSRFRRNSWRPVFRGRLVATETGSRLEGTVGWHPMVQAFTAAWLVLLAIIVVTGEINLATNAFRGDWSAGWGLAALPVVGCLFVSVMVGLTSLGSRAGRKDEAFLMAWLAEKLKSSTI
jgi:hypothetical protein